METLQNRLVDELIPQLLETFEKLSYRKPKERQIGWSEGNSQVSGWEAQATDVWTTLKREYPDSDGRVNGTRVKQVGEIKNALKDTSIWKMKRKDGDSIINPEQKRKVQSIIIHFSNALAMLARADKNVMNERYRLQVKDRSSRENRIKIDATEPLQQAYDVLSNLENLKASQWRMVSCALALSTGRRMSEIHSSASFEPIEGETHTLQFTGQLKGKGRMIGDDDLIDAPFEIPTLIPSKLCTKGLAWLEENNKRVESPKRVNSMYSKYLSQQVKSNWAFMGEETTYHKFRGLYYALSIRNLMQDDEYAYEDFEELAPAILGDEDLEVVKSYKRFNVREMDITRI